MAKSNYENYTKEQLIEELQKLSKRKKYGLVWEEEKTKEKFEADAEGKLPVLVEDKKREIKTDANKPTNILIEGDNYHALSVLNYTHAKSIDVIYIDPPYNTGNKSWKYNNQYVEKDDAYKHSRWLSFMSKRLRLAKNLLKNDGVIIATIDDYEIGNLNLLMNEIFGEDNKLGVITIMHNPRGRSDDKYFATSHEYALFYGLNTQFTKTNKLKLTEEQIEGFPLEDEISFYRLLPLKRTGSNSTPDKRPNLFYPIYYNKETKQVSVEAEKDKDWAKILPIDSNEGKRVWRWGKISFAEKADTEIIIKENNGKYTVFAKDRIKGGRKPKTVWADPKYDASSHGTILLQKILGKSMAFDYPKSLYAVVDTLQICVDNNKNVIILDFFAGSGTTGHAVMSLNKEDEGKRQFILCTNNENNICTDVCYPRVKKVIQGYKNGKGDKVEGLGGNLKYYKTNFVGSEPTHRNKKLLTDKSIEMLCIKENTFDEVINKKDFIIFKNKEKFTAILFDEMKMEEFKNEIKKLKMPISVYVFSLEGDDFKEEFENLKNDITLCSIPEAILKVYRRIYGAGQMKLKSKK